jgi:hypothetical protein
MVGRVEFAGDVEKGWGEVVVILKDILLAGDIYLQVGQVTARKSNKG